MTDQQPHTPYIEDGWLVEPCEPDYAPGISQPIPGSWSKPIVNLAELDGYDELIAAAEQRGAEAALLCVDEPSWEHHDQTDGFPCTNCLNKAQKGIDRYRADRIANKEGDIA